LGVARDEAVYSTSTENSTAAENGLLPQDMERVKAVKERYESELMSQQDVQGVGVGRDDSGEGAMVVYIDRTSGRAHAMPDRLDNVKVQVILTDRFVAR
jgi:hypothetical protein